MSFTFIVILSLSTLVSTSKAKALPFQLHFDDPSNFLVQYNKFKSAIGLPENPHKPLTLMIEKPEVGKKLPFNLRAIVRNLKREYPNLKIKYEYLLNISQTTEVEIYENENLSQVENATRLVQSFLGIEGGLFFNFKGRSLGASHRFGLVKLGTSMGWFLWFLKDQIWISIRNPSTFNSALLKDIGTASLWGIYIYFFTRTIEYLMNFRNQGLENDVIPEGESNQVVSGMALLSSNTIAAAVLNVFRGGVFSLNVPFEGLKMMWAMMLFDSIDQTILKPKRYKLFPIVNVIVWDVIYMLLLTANNLVLANPSMTDPLLLGASAVWTGATVVGYAYTGHKILPGILKGIRKIQRYQKTPAQNRFAIKLIEKVVIVSD